MPAEVGIIGASDLASVNSIAFTSIFERDLNNFLSLMGVNRKLPLTEGMRVQIYKTVKDIKNSNIGPGEEAPLSKVVKSLDHEEVLTLAKWRKAVTVEAGLSGGAESALDDTDAEILAEAQDEIITKFFALLATGTGAGSGVGLQGAIAKASGLVKTAIGKKATNVVVFVNTMDAYKYLGTTGVSTQTEFGMAFLANFLGSTLVISSDVPAGTIYATASQNVVFAYIPTTRLNELSPSFTTDATGYIGMKHYEGHTTNTMETMLVSGVKFFAERLDGVAVVDILTEGEALVLAIANATDAVVYAEASDTAEDKAAAQVLVTELPDGATKIALQARIDAIVVA